MVANLRVSFPVSRTEHYLTPVFLTQPHNRSARNSRLSEMSPKTHTNIAVLFSCFLIPFAAGATGLGEMRVSSQLGDRFHAEIPLLNPTSSIVPSCFNLTTRSTEAISDVPWLQGAQIALESSPPRLVISTRRQVSDPIIQLAIYTGCGTYLTRHFTALLSPPERVKSLPIAAPLRTNAGSTASNTASGKQVNDSRSATRNEGMPPRQAGETAADMARRLYPKDQQAQEVFVKRMDAFKPEWLVAEPPEETRPVVAVPQDQTPPARPVVKARPKPVVASSKKPETRVKAESKADNVDRLVLMPTDEPTVEPKVELTPPEKSVSTVGSGEIGSRLVDLEHQIVTMRSQLNALRAEYPTPPPAMQTLFIEMESRLLAVELSVARVKLSTLATDASAKAPVADTQVNSASTEKADLAPTPPPTPSQKPAAAPLQETSKPSRDVAEPSSLSTGLLMLGMFGLGLGAFLFHRARRASVVPISASVVTRLEDDVTDPVRETPARRTVLPATREVDETAEAQKVLDAMLPTRVAEDTRRGDLDFSPIELANIMLSFGRAQGAVEVLQDFVRDNPSESLQPGLRLLEIYKQTDMRREFEQMAGQLAHRFNVERVHWNQDFLPATEAIPLGVDAPRTPGSLSVMPMHIKTRIAANWGTSDCLAYLQSLLSDTRGGARRGFSVLVTQEILGVIKTLEAQLKSRKTA